MKLPEIPFMCWGMMLGATTLYAQGGPGAVEFSFSNPGARAMGLGGAFAALADDATAAFANPAGLVQLVKPEVSVEGRRWGFSTPFVEGGRLSGTPTGILLDDTAGLRTAISSQNLSAVSFLSFVYPSGDWSVAAYRHQLAKFQDFSETQGFFVEAPASDAARLTDVRKAADLDIVAYGLTGAYRLTEDLSIGAGIVYFQGDLDVATDVFEPLEQTLPDGLFGENTYFDGARSLTDAASMDGSDWGFNVGVLWHISPQWNVGGFYRPGPTFRVEAEVRSGPATEALLPSDTIIFAGSTPLGIPDVWGLGGAFRSRGGTVTVGFEWDYIQYSTLLDSLDPEVASPDEVALDDGHELRAGLEYVFIGLRPVVALRVGAWRDPDHRIRSVLDNPFAQALFPPGSDRMHFTFGGGFSFERVQFDFGADLSDEVDTLSLSAILSF